MTRTVHFGTPSAFEKVRLLKLHSASRNEVHYHLISSVVSFPVFQECFTYVLKGHIAVSAAVFPNGTKGATCLPATVFHSFNFGVTLTG